MPNATFVLARGGIVLYKAMWTSADRLSEFLERQQALPPDPRNVPVYTEHLEIRKRDAEQFTRGLERNGPRAVAEFGRAGKVWAERARSAAPARRVS